MQRWKEHHYARATEFVHLVGEALGGHTAPVPHPSGPATPRPMTPANVPKPAAATAAAVFKSIPWKK